MIRGKNVAVREEDKAAFIDRAYEAMRGSADDLRHKGYMVAVHNDYLLGGVLHTFWLVTKHVEGSRSCVAYKGEAPTDAEALDLIRGAIAKDTDKLHHAPMCPANHYEGMRPPTDSCSCGAVEMEKKE